MMLFISHASSDDAFVNRLTDDLKAKNVMTWVDHQDIPAGAAWDQAIETAINNCDVLLFLVTAASLASNVCTDEWNHALSLNKNVIPIMLGEGLANHDLPFRLKRKQWVDLRGDYTSGFDKLVTALNLPAKLLPEIEWCTIPAGKASVAFGSWQWKQRHYTVERRQNYAVDAFQLAKYPITVAQYRHFLDAEGYQNRAYWTGAGWAWRIENQITQPAYWLQPDYQVDKYPVVGVSWYEATAFCQWLSAQTGTIIQLPPEWAWLRAAQGDDQRQYAWGNPFDPQHANTQEASIGHLTAVDHYPGGVSAYGVWDTNGNVWEWMFNQWDGKTTLESEAARTICGGSWQFNNQFAANIVRRYFFPHVRLEDIGFRICQG